MISKSTGFASREQSSNKGKKMSCVSHHQKGSTRKLLEKKREKEKEKDKKKKRSNNPQLSHDE